MIKSVIDSRITEQLYKIYELDIDGFVTNQEQVKTFNFEYEWPVVDFLEPIFMPLFHNIDSNFRRNGHLVGWKTLGILLFTTFAAFENLWIKKLYLL